MMSNQATDSPRQIPRRPQSAATHDLIVRVTEHAIFELGMTRVTTRRIATSAGIAEATIFRYFATKDELVLAALKQRNASSAEILDAVAHLDGTVLENITRATEATLRYYDGVLWAAIAAMADTSLLPRHREWLLGEAFVAELSRIVKNYVGRERSTGRVRRDVDPALIADVLLGAVFRHVVGRMFRGDATQQSDRRFVGELARGLSSMIAPEIPRPEIAGKLRPSKRSRSAGAKRPPAAAGSAGVERRRDGSRS
jgi:AcrR family transcriptional regulator